MKHGRLIIIEAGDGSGKETQTGLLFDRLKKEGKTVEKVTFPDYDSDSSALVRMYLGGSFGKRAADVNAYAASAFFAVDRYASFQLKWRHLYESGAIIMADRYTTSNMVHQAVKIVDEAEREQFLNWLWDFEFQKMGLPVPDRVIFLDMAPEVADRLIALRAEKNSQEKDIHERDKEYLRRCYSAYGEIADKYGWKRIICSENGEPRTREAIAEEVYNAVKDLL